MRSIIAAMAEAGILETLASVSKTINRVPDRSGARRFRTGKSYRADESAKIKAALEDEKLSAQPEFLMGREIALDAINAWKTATREEIIKDIRVGLKVMGYDPAKALPELKPYQQEVVKHCEELFAQDAMQEPANRIFIDECASVPAWPANVVSEALEHEPEIVKELIYRRIDGESAADRNNRIKREKRAAAKLGAS